MAQPPPPLPPELRDNWYQAPDGSRHQAIYASPAFYDERSGLHVAEQAHAAGAVKPTEELPNFTVQIEFSFHGTLEEAHRAADLVSLELIVNDQTRRVTRTVTAR